MEYIKKPSNNFGNLLIKEQYQVFILPARIILHGNQMVNERDVHRHRGIWANKWASNAGIRISIFCIPNAIMDLGNDHHGLKTLQKEVQLFIVCLLMKVHTTIYKVFLIKKSNLDLIKSLDLITTSLQEIRGQRNMLKQHTKDIISKMEMWEILQVKPPAFFNRLIAR